MGIGNNEEETLVTLKLRVFEKIPDICSNMEISRCISIFMDELFEEFKRNNGFLRIKNLGTFYIKEGFSHTKTNRIYFICSENLKNILKKRFVRFTDQSPQKKFPKKARRAKKYFEKKQ
jgi:hypothetical protein